MESLNLRHLYQFGQPNDDRHRLPVIDPCIVTKNKTLFQLVLTFGSYYRTNTCLVSMLSRSSFELIEPPINNQKVININVGDFRRRLECSNYFSVIPTILFCNLSLVYNDSNDTKEILKGILPQTYSRYRRIKQHICWCTTTSDMRS